MRGRQRTGRILKGFVFIEFQGMPRDIEVRLRIKASWLRGLMVEASGLRGSGTGAAEILLGLQILYVKNVTH